MASAAAISLSSSLRRGATPGRAGTIEESSLTRPGSVVGTDRLPADVHDSAMDFVNQIGRRVITGDVASRAGLQIDQADRALQDFAADTGLSGGFSERRVVVRLPQGLHGKARWQIIHNAPRSTG